MDKVARTLSELHKRRRDLEDNRHRALRMVQAVRRSAVPEMGAQVDALIAEIDRQIAVVDDSLAGLLVRYHSRIAS